MLEGLFSIVRRIYGLEIQNGKILILGIQGCVFLILWMRVANYAASFILISMPVATNAVELGWTIVCPANATREAKYNFRLLTLPVNLTPPLGNKPTLFTHNEVITLFHEFGHGLHHMLTKVDYPSVAGIGGVPWDAVELPSQFMENWCWQREALIVASLPNA